MNDRSKGKPDYTKFMKKPASLEIDPPAEPILPQPVKSSPDIPSAEIILLTESEESAPSLSLKRFDIVEISSSEAPARGAFAAHVKQIGGDSPTPGAPPQEKKAISGRRAISVDDLEIPLPHVDEQPLRPHPLTIFEPPPAPVMLFGLIVIILAAYV